MEDGTYDKISVSKRKYKWFIENLRPVFRLWSDPTLLYVLRMSHRPKLLECYNQITVCHLFILVRTICITLVYIYFQLTPVLTLWHSKVSLRSISTFYSSQNSPLHKWIIFYKPTFERLISCCKT